MLAALQAEGAPLTVIHETCWGRIESAILLSGFEQVLIMHIIVTRIACIWEGRSTAIDA